MEFTVARAAVMSCSDLAQSLIPALAGRAFLNQFMKKASSTKQIQVMEYPEPK
jgi:hypothetical protein